METVHVLIISDNRDEIERVRDLLRTEKGEAVRYHLDVVSEYRSALRDLVRNTYDIYLVDQIVPDAQLSGVELIQKANAGGCRSPILLLTTMSDEDISWALDDMGAAGHIHKYLDFQERAFRNAIRVALRHYRDVTEVREQLRDLQRQVAELLQTFERRG